MTGRVAVVRLVHEVVDTLETGDGADDGRFDCGPGGFELGGIVMVGADVVHLTEGNLNGVGDERGARDPDAGCFVLDCSFWLLSDERRGGVAELVNSHVGFVLLRHHVHVETALLAGVNKSFVDVRRRLTGVIRLIARLSYLILQRVVDGLEGILVDVGESGVEVIHRRHDNVGVIAKLGGQIRGMINAIEQTVRLEDAEEGEVAAATCSV